MAKITILAVREENNLLVIEKKLYPDIDLINFPIVKDREPYLSNSFSLLHAIGASPAKYVEHAFQKAEKHINGPCFLLNPLAQLNEEIWISLLYRLNEIDKTKCTLISSANDIPFGLYIPETMAHIFSKIYLLRFLSFVSTALDFPLIKAFFNDAKMVFICQNDMLAPDTGFYTDTQNLTIYKLTTSHYLQALLTSHNLNIQSHMAVMPYHAGDVLFLCHALKESSHPFDVIMVNEAYAEIVNKILPEINLHIIDSDPINRGKNKNNARQKNIEPLYFLDVIYPNIPINAAFQYLRPSRSCDEAKIHFIDQWKASVSNNDYPLVPKHQSSEYKKRKYIEKSIFIHFDAGWHLKIYPLAYQRILIKLLKKAGYRITILAEKNLMLDVDDYIKYTNINALENAILSHAIFLGMDSFPNHYATHVLKHPSITLFSSTKVENADAPDSAAHKDLHNALSCSPCRAQNICPKYRLDFCKNFTSPQIVFDAITGMYETLYSEELK